ncbi:MAG: efflux RND transporter periplasmic adaptor subunit [Planctomycetes bacterium]|nr:efflux RND transporter periplasmic adaptor subunit [Planctomycetota bacterium]
MRRSKRLAAIVRVLPKLLGVVALGLIILWMSFGFHSRVGPGESPYERPTAGDRQVVPVRPLSTTETISAVGTVRPRRRTEVASQLLATIREITVNPGDAVQAGQLLLTLDDREIQAQLREAEAAVSGVRADLAVRERDYARYKQMFSENAVTKEDFDRIEGILQVTKAQLERAQQQVERIQVMVSYTSIKAQQAGIVSDRFADPGDLAAPGKPLLAVHDPSELELHADVREGLATHIKLGMKLGVRVDSADLDGDGTVREIVPQAEAESRSVLAKITLPKGWPEKLYSGMFGRLEIPVGELDHTVIVADAVQTIGQLEMVDVVGEGDTLERRYVRVGERIENDVEILSGLRVGERVALPSRDMPKMLPKEQASRPS